MPGALSKALGGLGEPQPGGAMARRAGPPSLWSGNERLRVGERLQASLAGILELDLLRETQRSSVERALGRSQGGGSLQQDDQSSLAGNKLPPSTKLDRSKSEDLLGGPPKSCVSYCSSDDIETDSRARAGDGPDKTCLGLRMANEQLCFPKKAGGGDPQEILEADSRPSSGFYETSEMGSLSDSCASIHSDGPGGSRGSAGSLSQLPGLRESSCVRPRSTDEAAVRLLDLQLQRLALASSHGADTRRPVSTGDLEFLLGELALPLSKNPSLQLLQYKSDLVSRNTNEIYHYPSPLHAVALQSPLFTSSLSQSSSQEDLDEGTPELAGADSPETAPACSKDQQKIRLDRYIATLVLRYKCRSVANRTEAGYLPGNQKSLSMLSVCSSALGASQLLAPAPGWKIRRRISTCSHLRSPEGSEGTRDSQVLDGQGDFTPFLEISSIQSSRTNLSKACEPLVMSLPDPLPPYQEPSFVPSPKKQPNSLERGVLDWGDGAGHRMVQPETPVRKETPRVAVDFDRLYKGKHASRDLVKAAEKPEKSAERSWLNPRELLRRLSLRRKPSVRTGSRARASSEINIHVAAGMVCHGDPHAGKGKAVKPKWTSVLEISSKASGRPRLKAHTFQPPPGLSRHLAFSANSPPPVRFLGGSQVDLPPRQRARLCEVDSTSAVSLNGDWILHHLGDRWPRSSATLDSADLAVGSFKLRRSRSFKELKRMMSRSIKSSRAAK
ncbi:dapper homolog 2-like [Tiliqua scincoides]|uniref:dapper homolog 2-like n=1 Tax=Tiliqua scincoides TaxID=71010 RepID=UPI00346333DA